jgi:HEAT repeat protein
MSLRFAKMLLLSTWGEKSFRTSLPIVVRGYLTTLFPGFTIFLAQFSLFMTVLIITCTSSFVSPSYCTTISDVESWERKKDLHKLILSLGDNDLNVRLAATEALERLDEPLGRLIYESLKGSTEARSELAGRNDPRAIFPLVKALNDHTSSVVQAAILALEEIGDTRTITPLLNTLGSKYSDIRKAAAHALGTLKEPLGKQIYEALQGSQAARKEIALNQDPRVISPLIKALDAWDSNIRHNAVLMLAVLGDDRAVDGLLHAIKDGEPKVYWAAALALQKKEGTRGVSKLVEYFSNGNADQREAVVWALAKKNDPQALETLLKALRDRFALVRRAAAYSLEYFDDPRVVLSIVAALTDISPGVREAAVWTLGKLGDQRTVEPLINVLGDESPKVREAAVWALGKLGDQRAVEPLINVLGDESPKVREAAVWTLGKLGDQKAVDTLIYVLGDNSPKVREAAVWTLGKLGDKKAIVPLFKSLGKGPSQIRDKVVIALERLGAPMGQLISDSLKGSREARGKLSMSKDPRAVTSLAEALNDKEWGVRREAAMTLAAINDHGAVDALMSMANSWNPYDRFYAIHVLAKMKQGGLSDYLVTTATILFGSPAGRVYSIITLSLLVLTVLLIQKKGRTMVNLLHRSLLPK